jgi:hypothetical protein
VTAQFADIAPHEAIIVNRANREKTALSYVLRH